MNLQVQRVSWLYTLVLFFALLAGSAGAQTTLIYEGFETPGFTNRWRVGDQFLSEDPITWGVVNYAFGGETTHTGTNKLYCSATSFGASTTAPYYQDNMSTYFERDFNVTNMNTITLSFWYKARMYVIDNDIDYANEFLWDTLTVYIDDMPIWDTSMLEAPVSLWTPVVINLDDYGIGAGMHTLRFEFDSDGGGQEDNSARGEGVYVDDVLVTANPAYPDYNKDSVPDLVWWRTNGYSVTWLMTNAPAYNGTNVAGPEYKSTYYLRGSYQITEPGWEIVSQGDYNLDNRSDLLFKNKDGRMNIWYMNGPGVISTAAVNYRQTTAWQFVTAGDFNNDKYRDFVWMNTTSRQVCIWNMKNNAYQWTTYLLKSDKVTKYSVLSGYNIVLMYDFNQDGSKDMLVQRSSDGAMFIHYFSGNVNIAAKSGEGFSFGTTGIKTSGWKVVGATDFNHDGHIDLLVQHTDGRIGIWYMYRNTVTGMRIIKAKTPVGWKLVGPR